MKAGTDRGLALTMAGADRRAGAPASRSALAIDRSSLVQLLAGLTLVVGSICIPALIGSAYWSYNFRLVNLFVTVAVLQNMLLSDAGQVSFGQGAVFGLAAFATGIVSGMWGYPYAVGFVAGVAAAALLGLIFALPALRVQGYYL